LFVDNALQINEKAVYLDHHTDIHFDVSLDVGTSVPYDSTAERKLFCGVKLLKQESLTTSSPKTMC
jgi:hypothetical protein